MFRGTYNEAIALRSLHDKQGAHIIFETGLMKKCNEEYFACSPDVLDLLNIGVLDGVDECILSRNALWEESSLAVVAVEIKSRIS